MSFDFEKYKKRAQSGNIVRSLKSFQDYIKFFNECIKIRAEAGGAISFNLRRAQRRLLQEYLRAKQEGRGIRIVHLKARQYGGSTLIQALLVLNAIQHGDAAFLTVAHDLDSAKHLIEDMAIYMLRHACPSVDVSIIKQRQHPMAEAILSNNSKITAVTAKNLNLGRSKTFRFLHLSEVAFWWRTLKTVDAADDIFQSLMSTVPEPTEVPDSVVILESTGYGRQGAFYDYYQDAVEGKSYWIPFFVPWYEIEKYEDPVSENQQDKVELFQELLEDWDNPRGKLVDKLGLDRWELSLIHTTKGQLSWGQILWRRRKLHDFRGEIERFNQEYPATEDDAFSATGSPAFSPNAMVWYEEQVKAKSDFVRYDVILTKDKQKLIEDYGGFLHVWDRPVAGAKYVIGADVAAGDSAHKFRATKASYSAAQVLRVDNKQIVQVAEYMARPDPMEFGEILAAIGYWYSTALIVVERNADGLSTIGELLHKEYPAIYTPVLPNRQGDFRPVYGVQTDMKTKKQMLNQMRYLIGHREIEIRSLRLVQQMHTVHYTPDGRIMMPRTADLVMSMMIGLTAVLDNTVLIEEPEIEDRGLIWDPELGLISRLL